MNEPIYEDFHYDDRTYFMELSGYWEAIAGDCLERLIELEEIRRNEAGEWYWTASGDAVGGE